MAAAFLSGSVAKLLIVGINVLVVALCVREVGASAYGVIAVFGGLVNMIGFLDLGIGNALISSLSAAEESGEPEDSSRIISSGLAALCAIGLTVIVVGALITAIVPTAVFFDAPGQSVSDLRLSLLIFVISISASLPALVGNRICLARQRGYVNNLYLLAGSVITLLMVVFLSLGNFAVWVFVGAVLLGPVAASFVQSVFFLFYSKQRVPIGWKLVSKSDLHLLLGRSSGFLMLGISAAVSQQSAVVIVAYALDSVAAGVLGVALRMFGLVTGLFATGMQQSWASMARAFERNDLRWIRKNVASVGFISVALACIVSSVLVAIGRWLCREWVGSGLIPSRGVLVWTAVYTVYLLVSTQISFVLNAANQVGRQALVWTLCVCVQIPLAFSFAHLCGVPGPLIAFMIVHSTVVGIPSGVWAWRAVRVAPNVGEPRTARDRWWSRSSVRAR
ncbi:hypothetical protein [Gordonia sp. N1V]|uniref:lipopolysaccharide biosynthesis protein n=1 Tax=Gordonia sp. N1V TaxID=3034163 RepID=UPI0023E1719B|nr:hypothetical protein [Gordonia sp. N1V]MDF3284678.1 hypothetical protein [Gordonia sp. N1V]